MKTVIGAAAFALGVSGAILPRQQCCFSLTASGGQSGSVRQLGDGQNRIGSGSGLSGSGATYCINNGALTDSQGRGCILTAPTTQFQCDVGATPQSGFSVSSSGELEYQGSTTFYACAASDSEYNIYTQTSSAQTKCSQIMLSTGGQCAGSSGGSSSASAASGTGASTAPVNSGSAPAGYSSAQASTPASSTPAQASTPAASAYSSAQASTPAASSPAQASTPAASAYSSVGKSSSAATAPAQSGSMSAPAYSAPAQSSAPAPATSAVSVNTLTAYTSQASAPAASNSAPKSYGGSSPVASNSAASTPVVSTPVASTSAASSPAAGTPATGTYPAASGKTSASACQTSLSGAYQTPHLIVPVSSSSPSTAYGTSYFGQINSTTSTIFNFDIPASYAGMHCSIIFLLPEQSQLETSSYQLSGSGSIVFSELSSAASQQTTWNSVPKVASQLGSIAVKPGNSYIIATESCKAGTTESIELSSMGGLGLNFFEDYNPAALGLYITAC